jgi:hypothetical protein
MCIHNITVYIYTHDITAYTYAHDYIDSLFMTIITCQLPSSQTAQFRNKTLRHHAMST